MIRKVLIILIGATFTMTGFAAVQPEFAFTYDSMLTASFGDNNGMIHFDGLSPIK